ncbi:RAS2 protein [Vanrija albida]|uniref:RAS2 protein n=1 Tax=Vanrija albida TaxID=181172 RepID=A0ABR3QEP9_9TREE
MSQSSRMVFKITVLGDGGVGKTALTVQFTMSSFVETYDPTIEDCYRKQWVVDEQPCLLEVLDTAGQEEYTALRDQWIRDGEGFLVVYSVTTKSTWSRVEKIVDRVMLVKNENSHAAADSPGYSPGQRRATSAAQRMKTPIVIVGNKRDMTNNREVTPEEGRALAQSLGCDFYETSARLNQNVEAAFKSLVRQIKIAKQGGEAPTEKSGSQQPAEKKKKHKKCVVL